MPFPNLGFIGNTSLAGAQGGLTGGWKGAGVGAGSAALGAIPGPIGPIASGVFGGGMSGASGSTTGLSDEGNKALQKRHIQAAEAKYPSSMSKGRSALRGGLIGASALIPGIGPFVAPALAAYGQYKGKQEGKQFGKQVAATGQLNQKALKRAAMLDKYSKPQQPGQTNRIAGATAGGPMMGGPSRLAQLARQRQSADRTAAATGGGNDRTAAATGGGGGNNNNRTAASTGGGNNNRTAAVESFNGDSGWDDALEHGQNQVNKAYKQNQKNQRGWGGGLQNLLRDQIAQGLDPRILTGLLNSATQSTQDATQNLNDTFSRTGDQSGYNYGIQSGMQQELGQQLANVRSEFLRQQQAYKNDLINMFRSTRGRGTGQPLGAGGGSNLGGILSGIGGLGQAAASMYGAFNQPATNNTGPGGWRPGMGMG